MKSSATRQERCLKVVKSRHFMALIVPFIDEFEKRNDKDDDDVYKRFYQ